MVEYVSDVVLGPDLRAVSITTTERSARNISELVASYLRAVERFRALQEPAASQSTEPSKARRIDHLAQAALFEALNWVDIIDDYLAAGPRDTAGTPRDTEWAQKLPGDDPDLVLGFRIARNVVHHRWANAVATHTAPHSGATERLWADLPPRKRTSSEKIEAASYDRRLRGRPVLSSLDDMARVLWQHRGWAITRADLGQPGYPVATPLALDPDMPG